MTKTKKIKKTYYYRTNLGEDHLDALGDQILEFGGRVLNPNLKNELQAARSDADFFIDHDVSGTPQVVYKVTIETLQVVVSKRNKKR